jgi:CheY-like chemotaxis protein
MDVKPVGTESENAGTVLVVDDDRNAVDILNRLLTKEGFVVHCAHGGREAVTLANTHPVDVILLDVMMPDMDGFQVCEALRGNDRTRTIPIILLTAKDDMETRVVGTRRGAASPSARLLLVPPGAQCPGSAGLAFSAAGFSVLAGCPSFGAASASFLHFSTSAVEISIVSAMSCADRPIFTDFMTIPQFTSAAKLGVATANIRTPAATLSNAVRMLEPPCYVDGARSHRVWGNKVSERTPRARVAVAMCDADYTTLRIRTQGFRQPRGARASRPSSVLW